MSSELPVALCIMAKIPQAGLCKTRLAAAVSHEDAAALSRAFVADTIANVSAVAARTSGSAFVAYTPCAPDADVRAAFGSSIATLVQRGESFGDRLFNAICDLLERGHRAVCVIDSDSPTLPPSALAEAVEACDGSDRVVLGPAADGGYYLLGIARGHRELFEGITWSSGVVAAQTIAKAELLDLPVTRLQMWYDVDEPADLATLETEFDYGSPEGGFAAPATRDALFRIRTAGTSLLSNAS